MKIKHFAAVLVVMTIGFGAIPLHADVARPPARRLEGAWTMMVTPVVSPEAPPPAARQAYVSFAHGGAAISSDRLAPFAGPAHGAWEHVSGRTFLYTFIADNFNAAGTFLGTLKVRFRITLTDADSFEGVDTAELRDAAGNLLFTRCNTVSGERIKPEPVSEECETEASAAR